MSITVSSSSSASIVLSLPSGLPGAGVGEVLQEDATPTPTTDLSRPDDYSPDSVWIENAWEDIAGVDAFAGGGRWNTQVFFACDDSIYFEELS